MAILERQTHPIQPALQSGELVRANTPPQADKKTSNRFMKGIESITGVRRPAMIFQRFTPTEPYHDLLNEYAPKRNTVFDLIKSRKAAKKEDDKSKTQTVTRRTILKAMGLAGARFTVGSAVGAETAISVDAIIGEEIWGGTNPEIHTLPNAEAARKFPTTHTLVIGGYNVENPDVIGQTIGETMFKYGQISYLKHSNEGMQMGDLKREIDRFVEEQNVKQLYFYGHSMGGMVAVELAAYLAQKDIQINTLMFDCSPLDFKDIQPSRRDEAGALVALDELDIHGGAATRFGIEFAARWLEGRRDFNQMCADAWGQVNSEKCSNKLVQSQARYMDQFDLNDFVHAFSPFTKFVYLHPDNMASDTTIENASAMKRLMEAFPQNQIFTPQIAGSAHANPLSKPKEYNDALRWVAEKCYFYDGTPLRYDPKSKSMIR